MAEFTVQCTETQKYWLEARAGDENVPMAQVVRRGIDREMAANPHTSKPGLDQLVAHYLKGRSS